MDASSQFAGDAETTFDARSRKNGKWRTNMEQDRCAWCGEFGNDEQGEVREAHTSEEQFHADCEVPADRAERRNEVRA